MPIDKMQVDKNQENSIYAEDKDIYNKPIRSKPLPEKEVGIDTGNHFLLDLIQAGESNQLDATALNQFTTVSQGRDSIYSLIDTMCEDPIISAVLETYAEDATEENDNGRIVWAESNDPDTAKYINFLLDSASVDKNVYKWTHSLCKYGDVYLRLYRQSDYEQDDLFEEKKSEGLNEDINVKAYSKDDHYVHYFEMMPNPAEVFELTKFGKTYAYVDAPVLIPSQQATNKDMYTMNMYRYTFHKKDIDVYGATDFVHGCLEDNSSRTPEYVSIFMDKDADESKDASTTYTVRRGQSLFYNTFKIWRELSLLQNAVLLNRVTKSSVVRAIQVEVGDMPKEEIVPYMQRIKQLFEQKSAIDVGKSLNEYTNAGPVENNVYIPTRAGQGNLTLQQVGGDLNVGQLTDLDYFRDLLFGSLRVPKQYFGFTDDGAGFSGGQSLSIISSRYAKMVKRIQSTICQMLTDGINLLLIDKGLTKYINGFSLHMVPPTTQEEIDRRDNIASKIRLVTDVMGMLGDVEDVKTRLTILRSMLAEALTNTEVAELIQKEIDKLENEQEEGLDDESPVDIDVNVEDEEKLDLDSTPELDLAGDLGFSEPEPRSEEPVTDTEPAEVTEEPSQNVLPSGSDLGIDLTNNNNF